LEARSKLSDPGVLEKAMLDKFSGLLDRSVECSVFVLKGLVEYYRSLMGLNEELEGDEEGVKLEVDAVLWKLTKEKVYQAFVEAQVIGNRLNVKIACEYLALHIRLRGTWSEEVPIWKRLVENCASETE